MFQKWSETVYSANRVFKDQVSQLISNNAACSLEEHAATECSCSKGLARAYQGRKHLAFGDVNIFKVKVCTSVVWFKIYSGGGV